MGWAPPYIVIWPFFQCQVPPPRPPPPPPQSVKSRPHVDAAQSRCSVLGAGGVLTIGSPQLDHWTGPTWRPVQTASSPTAWAGGGGGGRGTPLTSQLIYERIFTIKILSSYGIHDFDLVRCRKVAEKFFTTYFSEKWCILQL